MRDDRLVPDDLDAVLLTITGKPRYRHLHRPLYTIDDTFIVDFSGFGRNLSVITTEQGMETLRCNGLFTETRKAYKLTSKIDDSNESVGSALARFERSTLPDHRGTRTVVLRFLKIITPAKCVTPGYDGYICEPKEGD
jgi:hypothetical protein